MKISSQCRIFIVLMTLLATLFGAAYGAYELRGHADIISDVAKISGLISISTACVSYMFWTLTHLRRASVFRGGLAGLMTAFIIVQVPYFTSAFKTEVLRLHKSENLDPVMSVLAATPLSLKRGLETFQIISKVSLAAIIASAILGIVIAKTVPLQPREAKLTSE